MALSNAAIRAIAIRNNIKRREAALGQTPKAANDNRTRKMSKGLLNACVEAAGFDQNARFA